MNYYTNATLVHNIVMTVVSLFVAAGLVIVFKSIPILQIATCFVFFLLILFGWSYNKW